METEVSTDKEIYKGNLQLVISNTTSRRPPTSEEDIDIGERLEGEVLRGWSGAYKGRRKQGMAM